MQGGIGEVLLLGGIVAVFALVFVVAAIVSARRRGKKLAAQFGTVPPSHARDGSVSGYWDALVANHPDEDYLDQTTWHDLDMDLVFARLDSCLSSVGQEHFYALLHMPVNEEVLARRERLVGLFSDGSDGRGVDSSEGFRLRIQKILNSLGKSRDNGLWILMFRPQVLAIGSAGRYIVQALSPLVGVALLFVPVSFGPISLGAAVIALTLAANIVTFYWVRRKTERALGHVSYLIATLYCARKLERHLREADPKFAQTLSACLVRLKKLNSSSLLLAKPPDSDAAALIEFLGMLTLLPVVQYCQAVKQLAAHGEDLRELFALVGEVDVALSIASLRASLPHYTRPTFTTDLLLRGEGIFHPLVAQPVANDAAIDKNLLLTGSNASGKSTYSKALALNVLFAQTINTCCARSLTLKSAPLLTSMAVADNVTGAESYFVAEVRSMGRIVEKAAQGKQFYAFIDEILKGTNTIERIAASGAVLRFLAEKDCIVVVATHDLELVRILGATYHNAHFCEQMTSDGMSFDFLLKQGPSNTKNAIRLLEYYRYPAEVIAWANELGAALDSAVVDL